MKAVLQFLAAALIAALIAHAGVVLATPSMAMDAAMRRLAQAGPNMWAHAPRTSADSRSIVRPSPDLAYSACAFDLSNGPVRISASAWGDYMSLSLYADNTDNFFVISDREAPDGIDIALMRHGQRAPGQGAQIVFSPSTRGIALVRRLAPTRDRFAAADAQRQDDVCGPFAPTS